MATETAILATFTPPEAVIYLSGDFDIGTRRQLALRFDDAMDLGCAFLKVDASAVTFIDCSSLRVLADAQRRFAAAGGSSVVLRASSCFNRVARLAGFEDLICEPVASLRPGAANRGGRDSAAV
jgi:anti-anti-sigma factor